MCPIWAIGTSLGVVICLQPAAALLAMHSNVACRVCCLDGHDAGKKCRNAVHGHGSGLTDIDNDNDSQHVQPAHSPDSLVTRPFRHESLVDEPSFGLQTCVRRLNLRTAAATAFTHLHNCAVRLVARQLCVIGSID